MRTRAVPSSLTDRCPTCFKDDGAPNVRAAEDATEQAELARRDRLAAVPHRLPAEVAGLVEIQIEHATVPAALPASAKVGRRPPSARREYGRQPTVAFRQIVRTLQKKGPAQASPARLHSSEKTSRMMRS